MLFCKRPNRRSLLSSMRLRTATHLLRRTRPLQKNGQRSKLHRIFRSTRRAKLHRIVQSLLLWPLIITGFYQPRQLYFLQIHPRRQTLQLSPKPYHLRQSKRICLPLVILIPSPLIPIQVSNQVPKLRLLPHRPVLTVQGLLQPSTYHLSSLLGP